MRISIIVTTYNRPDALHLVLQSILHQDMLPNEVIIADDGSDERTREMLYRVRESSAVPIIHAWQEDLGFRAARVRNVAVSLARGEYLIFVDGDMILHPAFVQSHAKNARQGYFLHGKRAMLSDRLTARVLRRGQYRVSPWQFGIGLWKHAVHSEILSRQLSYNSRSWYSTQSANLSIWYEDFERVNGFNEDFEGWGREDSELALRLIRSGLIKYELRSCATAFHLAHGKDSRVRYSKETQRNQKLLEEIERTAEWRCVHGLSGHITAPEPGIAT
jgi:glycosyltransferase involved in cell wall biosynthesis